MSNLERDGSYVISAMEGGQQPALHGESPSTQSAPRSSHTAPTSLEDSGKVHLETLRLFVQQMAIRYQNGAVSRTDALSMVSSVATVRKLNDTFGAELVR